MAVQNDLLAAIEQIAYERKIPQEAIVESLKVAIVTAYKKDYPTYKEAEIRVDLNPETKGIKVFVLKEVIKDSDFEGDVSTISLKEAKKIQDSLKLGDKVEMELPVDAGFGRIAAQSAKQVIHQKIREEEKKSIIEEFQDKEGTIVSGNVQRVVQGNVIVEFGKATGVMPAEEKIYQEFYKTGEMYKFLLKKVVTDPEEKNQYSSELILSRADSEFLVQLFTLEVPEIASGTVEIKAVAREAGARSKLAVFSNQEGIDPIGSCVGQKGARIMNIQDELSDQKYEEKIDIIAWHEDPAQFVANALSPAKVLDVTLDEENGVANVLVDEDQLSLAIGKEGQNARLAHKLTGWTIEINYDEESKQKEESEGGEVEESDEKKEASEEDNAVEEEGKENAEEEKKENSKKNVKEKTTKKNAADDKVEKKSDKKKAKTKKTEAKAKE